MGGAVFLVRPLTIVGTIALARLLDPADFGQVALAMVLLGTSYMFVGLGMTSAVVHSNEDRHQVAFQAFVVTFLSGIVLFALFYAAAPWIVVQLGDVDLELFRALVPLVLLTGLMIVPDALLQKSLRFGRVSIAKIVSESSYFIVAIILALMGFGVWSLVYGRLASALVDLVLTWWFVPGWIWLKPLPWNWPLFRDLMSYGLRSTGAGIITYFHTHWDDWFVGRRFGSQSLGYYSKAYDLSNSTLSRLTSNVIGSVFFPAYAKIREDTERMRRVYLRSLQVVMLVMTPLALGLLVLAAEAIEVLLGAKWLPMTETLQVYCIMALMLPVSRNAVPVFQAAGRPQYNIYAGLLLSAVMVPMVFLLAPYGIVGVAAAVVTAHTVGALTNVYLLTRILPDTIRPTASMSALYLLLGGAMVLAVSLAKPVVGRAFGSTASIPALIILILVGAVVYCGLALLTQRELVMELVDLLRTVLQRGDRSSASVVKEVAG